MKRRWLLYLSVILVSVVAGAWLMVPLERQGAEAAPAWRHIVLPGSLSESHAFLENRCESCHRPLRGPEPQACVLCHATNSTVLANPTTVFHAVIGECATCHQEHRGRAQRPINMRHAGLLGLAEPRMSAWISRIGLSWPLQGSVLDGSEAYALESLNCLSCHATQDRHRGVFGTACATCHQLTEWTLAEFRHPSPRSTDCGQCHVPPPMHYMGHVQMELMMRSGKARVEQCFLCHRTSSWNDLLGVGWIDMH